MVGGPPEPARGSDSLELAEVLEAEVLQDVRFSLFG